MESIAPILSSAILGSSTSNTGGQQQNTFQMQEGQIVNALVGETKSADTFILNIGENRLLAKADSVTLSPGQSLQLQVTATKPQLELKIIAAPLQQYLGKALTFLAQNLDLSPLIQILQESTSLGMGNLSDASAKTLESFFAQQQRPLAGNEGGEVLRRMLEGIGLQTEAQLSQGLKNAEAGSLINSLKSALLEIVQQDLGSETLKEAGKTLLSTIESFQLSQLRLDHDKTLILPLPFAFLDQGYLLIDNKQEQGSEAHEEARQMHFSLHLALTGLGNLHIDFLQTEGGLWMRFNCDSQEKAEFVAQFSDELKEQLADLPLQGISFAGTANPPGADLVRMLVPAGQFLLNTKV
ncbi:MAG: hypothetical protein FD168_1881 [Desulfobulbaceae bacterium]|nr:MAG: hypothetical protein FD168_1881 [Desulfobulbaceae bacterium]